MTSAEILDAAQDVASPVAAALTSMVVMHARKVARIYRRKCWWAEEEELVQAATLAQLEAVHTYKPERGPLAPYLWRSGVYAARRSVIKQRSPVSHEHRLENLFYLRGEGLTFKTPEGEEVPRTDLLDPAPSPEMQVDAIDFAAKVRARVIALIGEDGAAFVFGVVTDEWKPREVAAHSGIDVERVYEAQRHLSSLLEGDPELYEYWRSRW